LSHNEIFLLFHKYINPSIFVTSLIINYFLDLLGVGVVVFVGVGVGVVSQNPPVQEPVLLYDTLNGGVVGINRLAQKLALFVVAGTFNITSLSIQSIYVIVTGVGLVLSTL
jgi:hypothetical protein